MSRFALTVTLACSFAVVAVAHGDEPAAAPTESKPTPITNAPDAAPAAPNVSLLGGGGFGNGFGFGGPGEFGGADGFGGAMGLPASAIPGRKWVAGSKVIVALSDDGKQVFAYSERHPLWSSQELEPLEGILAVPVVGDDLAAVRHGHYCYAYSTTLGTWDVLKLPAGELAVPQVGDAVSVHSASRGDFVFKNSWGKWFSADEIKAGRVAEYLLAQRQTGEPDQAEVGTTEVVTSFRLKHIQATEAVRIVRELYGLSVKRLAVEERTNSLLVLCAEQPLEKVEELLKAIDSPAARDLALPQPAQSVEDLGKLYNELDQRAQQLAAELRESGQNLPAAKQMNEDLRDLVRRAFEARQKLQRAELAEFAQQLNGIQQSIESRERIASQIIERRVEELLSPAVSWDGADAVEQPGAPADNDTSELQGKWRLERQTNPGGSIGTRLPVQDLIVSGKTWVMITDGIPTTGDLLVDPTSNPKAITFTRESNGTRHQTFAIYRLDDNRLEILAFPDGRATRPVSFDERRAFIQTFERVVDRAGGTPSGGGALTARLPLELPARLTSYIIRR